MAMAMSMVVHGDRLRGGDRLWANGGRRPAVVVGLVARGRGRYSSSVVARCSV